jgi:hypothetical protein
LSGAAIRQQQLAVSYSLMIASWKTAYIDIELAVWGFAKWIAQRRFPLLIEAFFKCVKNRGVVLNGGITEFSE